MSLDKFRTFQLFSHYFFEYFFTLFLLFISGSEESLRQVMVRGWAALESQSSSRSLDSSFPSGCLVGQQRQEMSSGSLAALPASDENAEAAVEGRGAGLAAKARCPAAGRGWPSSSSWPGAPRMCQGNETCGRGDAGSWRDLPLGLAGGRGAAGPRGCSGLLSPITSCCSGLPASPLSRWPGAGAG